jgi:hypothetical protein
MIMMLYRRPWLAQMGWHCARGGPTGSCSRRMARAPIASFPSSSTSRSATIFPTFPTAPRPSVSSPSSSLAEPGPAKRCSERQGAGSASLWV